MTADFDLGGRIVPWGRDADEYGAFFALADVPSSARVLDCGGGPASFCAEWTRGGRSVVAADPVYARHAREIGADFEHTAPRMLEGMRQAYGRFRWSRHGAPEAVVERRRVALQDFLGDLSAGAPAGRYVAAALPHLPFRADAFDLVLCSHLLFLYSEELTLTDHLAFLDEMLRVGREVRVFPLLDLGGKRSVHLDGCIEELSRRARVTVLDVPYEFRVGEGRMLKLERPA